MSSTSRRYTDEEVAQILQAATNRQRRLGSGPTADGLSIESLREIGREIGLPAELVNDAAANLTVGRTGGIARLWPGSVRAHVQDRYPVALADPQLLELIDGARRADGTHGSVSEIPGGLEWHGDGEFVRVTTSVTRRGEDIVVDVGGNAQELTALVTILAPVLSTVAAAIVVDSIQPGTGGMLAIIGAGASTGLIIARGFWSRASRRVAARVERVRNALAAEVERLDA